MKEKQVRIVQIDKRGQIVIPMSARAELNIKEGDAFWVYVTGDGVFLKKVPAPQPVEKVIKRGV